MKYDLTKCNNLRWECIDDKGFCRVFVDAAGDSRISFVHSQVLCMGLPEETFRKTFELAKLDTIGNSDKEFLSAVKFIPRAPETYIDWQVGDEVEITNNEDYDYGKIVVVAARINDIVICKYLNTPEVYGTFTCEELKSHGNLILTGYEKELNDDTECEFEEGDVVLVRDDDTETWISGIFEGVRNDSSYPYRIQGTAGYVQCIPYNEKTWRLLGTTDEYKEE